MPLVLPNAPGRTGTSNTPRNVAYDGKAMVKQQGATFSGRHGLFHQIGIRPSSRQGSEQATVQACVAKVLGMIKAGQLPAPEANFKLTGVAYDPRFFNGPKGDVMAVEHVPEDGTPNSGKIIIFAPGAETMEKAVLCLAHEMWRFNKAEGADGNKAFAYAQGAQRIYNGGTYVGPTPVYEAGAEGDVKAEPKKETQANTPAETKPDTLGDMGDAIGNAASSALTAIGNALVPSANAAPAGGIQNSPQANYSRQERGFTAVQNPASNLDIVVDPAFAKFDPTNGTFNGFKLLPGDTLSLSPKGLAFISVKEGTRRDAATGLHILHNDTLGHCTIGIGHLVHTGNCTQQDYNKYPNGITDQEAQKLFAKDAQYRFQNLQRLLKGALITQPMYDAVFSIAYNSHVTQSWQLIKKLHAQDYAGAAAELNVARGKSAATGQYVFIRGLADRRVEEVSIFLFGKY